MQMRNPEISVIVPIYNAGEYLAPCIRSVLNQTFADFELILIDDASTDDSLKVCQSFDDARIRVIAKPQNEGVSRARNLGIDKADGRYLTFLDADDRLHPRFLELLYEPLSDGFDISVANFMRVDSKSHFEEIVFSGVAESLVEEYSPEDLIEKGLYQELLINSTCSGIYSASVFRDFRFPAIRYEDLDSFYKLFFKVKKIAYISAPLYAYTVNPASYTQTFSADRAVVLDVTERIIEYMSENCPRLVPAAQDRALSAAFNIFNLIAKNRADLPEIECRCKKIICRYRWSSLCNSRVRIKNKLGILITYAGGFRLLKFVARYCKNS